MGFITAGNLKEGIAMPFKILVTPRSFGKVDRLPVRMLEEIGWNIIFNTTGRIFTEDELAAVVAAVDGIIIGIDPLTARVINAAKHLKVISKYGVGVDNIDIGAAKQQGILVAYTPGVNSSAVAELAFGLALNVARKISTADRAIHNGDLTGQYSGIELEGKTLGILGTGRIGKQLALLAKGFKMKIICYDLFPDESWAGATGAQYLTLTDLLRQADLISCHLPLTEATHHLISAKELLLVKPGAIIINTARGEIIDENALYEALVNKRLLGAGLDVTESEPVTASRLIGLDNVVLTPHSGAHTREAIEKMGRLAAQNLIAGLTGAPPQFLI
jgi:D-3-phosphoglycerate dehydrogenase